MTNYDISSQEAAEDTAKQVLDELSDELSGPTIPARADVLVDVLDDIASRYPGISLTLPTQPTNEQLKRPWLAALLNACPTPLGIGYIYLGDWPRFFSVVGLQIFGPMLLAFLGFRTYSPYLLFILWLGSIIDAYNKAQEP